MPNEVVFTDDVALPNLVLKKNGKEIHASVMDIMNACSVSTELAKQIEGVQLFFLNKFNVQVSEAIASMMMAKADELYEDQKKTCVSTADSEG